MPAPAYIDLQGQTPIELAHRYFPVVERFSRRKSTPVTVKKSATHVGKTKGIPDVSGSFSIMVSTAGLAEMLALDDFTIAYTWSGVRYMILHCSWSDDDRGAEPRSGDNTMTLNFIGTAEVP